MILKLLDPVIYFVPMFINSIIFMATVFPNLIKRGGITVITPFHYRSLNKENEYYFRTLIQLDADIINFIPDPDQCKNDITWKILYAEKCEIHQKKIQKIMADLSGIYTIPWVLSICLIVFISLLTKDISGIIFYCQPIFWTIFIYVFRKIIFKNVFKYIISFGVFLIRKRIIGKNVNFLSSMGCE